MGMLAVCFLGPAKYFNLEKTLGTVETGKGAELVLLEANPLADINNPRKDGRSCLERSVFPKDRLQRMLADFEAIANRQ
jgi:imidazolonepropionase-like amidohydrolase